MTLATALAILQLRSAHSVYFGAGATCAAGLAKILKHIIRQPRPDSTRKQTFGMPSTHSASIGFMGTYLILASLMLAPHPLLTRFYQTPANRVLSAILAGLLATSVWWSRIRLGHHTKAQVVAGGGLGSTMAVLAFAQWEGSTWLSQHTTLCSTLPAICSYISREGWKVVGHRLEDITREACVAAVQAWKSRSLDMLWHVAQNALLAAKQAVFNN